MRVVIDIETDALTNVKHIWLVVCKDIDTGEYYKFRNITKDDNERERFLQFLRGVVCSPDHLVIGHNLLGFDWPILVSTLELHSEVLCPIHLDTLIISKLVDYSRKGHSIEDYGEEFGLEKGKFSDFSKYSQEMEDYCVRDVDICHKIYLKYKKYILNPAHAPSIRLEHDFQFVVNDLHSNGFAFNADKAEKLLSRVTIELALLDKDILEAFPPREVLIREFTPKPTKFGTISKTSIPRSLWENIADYQVGETYRHTRFYEFNPSSHKQVIQVLNEAGWSPTDRTVTHIDTERELSRLRYQPKTSGLDLQQKMLYDKLIELKKTGWKINETNLDTLPPTAPKPARTLAKRILLESRRRTLSEWLEIVKRSNDGRIHGRFYAIGAWTHRMAHQNPNTANIPNEFDTAGKKKLLGKELRSLWCAPKNRLLVGVDAEGIQLRIFAHLINDPEFTRALVEGKKDDKTDPHSLNQAILGSVCKSRQAAKRFIYALLLGAGLPKLAEILGCSEYEAKKALENLLGRYSGWTTLRDEVFPKDARRGWFTGLDGRKVRIPGINEGSRKHLAMSGYLQNGEAVVMKLATLKWRSQLMNAELWEDRIYRQLQDSFLVNLVHDEWQTECPNNMEVALIIARVQADSLRQVGEDLKLLCPLAGSYYNDEARDYTIANNWSYTH